MWVISILIQLLWLMCFGVFSINGLSGNVSSRPAIVNVGAIFNFNSTIGSVAKIAIEEAVKDVNSNSSVLPGTQLFVEMQNSNCTGFLGMVGAFQFMGTDTVAIIGPHSSVAAHTMSYIANEFQVPLLSFSATDSTLSSSQFPYFVRTTQSDQYQMMAVAEIVDYYGWKYVVAIFMDDDYGRNGASALEDALAARRCKILHKAGIPLLAGNSSEAAIMDILVKVSVMESRIIVLHAYPEVGLMVFSVARHLGMMSEGNVWIATDWLSSVLDSSNVPIHSDTIQGALFLRHHTPYSETKRAFLSRCKELTGGSSGLNSYALYAYDTVWLVAHALNSFFDQGGIISFSNDSKLSSSERSNLHLEEMKIFDGGPLLLSNIFQSDFVGLTGPIKFDSNKSLVLPSYDIVNVIGTGFREIGYWSNISGLSTLPPDKTLYSKPLNRSSAKQQLSGGVVWPGEVTTTPRGWGFSSNGKHLKIGVPIQLSFPEFVSQVPGTTNTFKGYCIDVFMAALSLVPYAVPYKFVPYGDGSENLNEFMQLVAAGVFDAAVGDIAITTSRTKIVDFTQPYASSGLIIVAPVKKLNAAPGTWAFLRPFSPTLWGVTAFFFVFIGIVVWVLEHRTNDEFRGPPKHQLTTILWFSLSTLFFAHRETTVSSLGRMVLLFWLFVVLIINSSYTASLTSILTVQQLYSPIKGIESLKHSQERIGYQVGSFAESFLTEEIGIPKSRLVALGSPEEYARELERGSDKGGVAAVVDERPYLELFLSSHCKFKSIGEEFTRSGWGFAFPRDSPLAVDLSTAILTLSENGELQRIHDKWLTRSLCSSEATEIKSDRLNLQSFGGLFLICGIVCFLALVAYFIQIMLKFRDARVDSNSEGQGSSRRLQTLLSLIDDKVDHSSRDNKRRRIEKPLADDNNEVTLGRNSKRRQSQVSDENIASSNEARLMNV